MISPRNHAQLTKAYALYHVSNISPRFYAIFIGLPACYGQKESRRSSCPERRLLFQALTALGRVVHFLRCALRLQKILRSCDLIEVYGFSIGRQSLCAAKQAASWRFDAILARFGRKLRRRVHQSKNSISCPELTPHRLRKNGKASLSVSRRFPSNEKLSSRRLLRWKYTPGRFSAQLDQ
jgi:hypothetical protein